MINRGIVISRRAALGSALALALTSCSGNGGSTAGGAGAAGADGAVTSASIGLIPVVEVSPIYLGIQKGFFRKRGLTLTPKQFQSGSAVVPPVIAGQVQFGFSNVVSLLAARDKGVPLVSVAGGGTSTGDRLRDINAVLVDRNSRMASPRDLVGKRIAINSWNSIGDTTIKAAVRKDGGDDWKIQFVRMPLPETPAQLAAGKVDAAWVPEPYRSQIINTGGRVLFDNLTETYPRVQISQYFTMEQVKQANPGLVAAFADGVKESMTYASAHPDELRAILSAYVKITPAIASALVLPDFLPDLDVQSTVALGQAAYLVGTLAKAPDVSGLLGTS
jgi:NitT/TauT family transport system substrate-binding protein